ncbi:type II toxin-antitoxin system HipA family toxin [Vitreimonas flagellata]|uniref:type II toxin-antitoxin system HipA family toxin n=1 Tax=Vitreimonas flagellata TaxID=2560861 RepID=UPI001074D83A|nr:type II toxin-antitoxin system HipA family toxin [Vitreimonas flagellata]
MAKRKTRPPLRVLLNGRAVGTLQRESSGAIEFQYDKDWIDWEHAIPVSLSLPMREDRYAGAPVVAVFDNLLPDNASIRRQIASRVRADGDDAYSLLSALGRDCVGALQFTLEGEEPKTRAGEIAGEAISDADIARILKNLAQAPLGVSGDAEFRISIAGAQEKTALLRHNGQWMRPHGATATTHILKPQIGMAANGMDLRQSVENEHFCMEVMRALGVTTAESAILDFDDVRALSVTRFDREWGKDGRLLRVPQEDMCQALGVHPTKKYENEGGPGMPKILDVLKASDEPRADQDRFLEAQFAFWLLGATDGHAKNFSIFLSQGGRFKMTPLYDILSVQPCVDANQIPWNKYKMAMAAGNSRHYGVNALQPRHFVETAQKSGVAQDRAVLLFEGVRARLPAAIDKVRGALPAEFPDALADSISNGALKRAHMDIAPNAPSADD